MRFPLSRKLLRKCNIKLCGLKTNAIDKFEKANFIYLQNEFNCLSNAQ